MSVSVCICSRVCAIIVFCSPAARGRTAKRHRSCSAPLRLRAYFSLLHPAACPMKIALKTNICTGKYLPRWPHVGQGKLIKCRRHCEGTHAHAGADQRARCLLTPGGCFSVHGISPHNFGAQRVSFVIGKCSAKPPNHTTAHPPTLSGERMQAVVQRPKLCWGPFSACGLLVDGGI